MYIWASACSYIPPWSFWASSSSKPICAAFWSTGHLYDLLPRKMHRNGKLKMNLGTCIHCHVFVYRNDTYIHTLLVESYTVDFLLWYILFFTIVRTTYSVKYCSIKYVPMHWCMHRWQFAFHSVVQYIKRKKGRSIWDQLCFRRLVLHAHCSSWLSIECLLLACHILCLHWLCRVMCKDYSEHYEKSLTVAKASKELRNKIHVRKQQCLHAACVLHVQLCPGFGEWHGIDWNHSLQE